MSKQLKFVVLAVLALAMMSGVFAVSASPAPQAAGLTDVTEVGFLVIDLAPLFIGIQNGYFKDEGLNMKFVEIDSGVLGVGAVSSGLAQFVDLGVSDVVDLQAAGKDAVLVYSMVNSLTMDLVVSDKALAAAGVDRSSPLADRYAALKGLTIGISRPGAPTELYPKWMMKQAGLNPDTDANFVSVGGAQNLQAALESGQIDAFMLSAPAPISIQNEGLGKILIMNSAGDVPALKQFAFESIAVMRPWAEANPQLVEGYSRAMDKANQFLIEHPEESVQILHDNYFSDTPIETVKLSLYGTLPAINPDGDLSEEAVKNQLTVSKEIGAIEEIPDTSEGKLWTNQWNPKTLPDTLQFVAPTEEATAEATP